MYFKYFSVKEIQNFLEQNHLAINKKFGQNFLINGGVVETLVKKLNATEKDLIIEIGCGLGSLTHRLLSIGCQLIGFEIDRAYIKLLKENYQNYSHFQLIAADFLKEYHVLNTILEKEKFNKVIILGNLPYYITTPILETIFTKPIYFDHLYFMMQQEVAERITAKEGTKKYGSLTIFCQFYTSQEIIVKLSPQSFYPKPQINSAIVHFEKKKILPQLSDSALFFNMIKSIFTSRRKQLINTLLHSPFLENLNHAIIAKSCDEIGIPLTIRGEMLSLESMVKLANQLAFNITEFKADNDL